MQKEISEKKEETQKIIVSYPPLSEGKKSLLVLVKPSKDMRGWSESYWIPKSISTYKKIDDFKAELVIPKWFSEKILKELRKKFCVSIKNNIFAVEYEQ